MRPEQFGIVSRWAVVVAVVATCVFTVGTPHGPAFGAGVVTAAQDAVEVEAALGLDRPTRRLVQQGLGHEGFEPGAPDGLFGPRTRAAIREWQAARDEPQTGYLAGDQVAALLAAVPRPVTASPEPHGPAPASAPAADAPAPVTAPDVGLSTAATDARSSATPDTAAPIAVESSRAPARASRPGELPPEILIDQRLVRVDRLLARDDHRAAHDVMNEVLALQREHEVALPAEFAFKYAQVASAAGLPETAVESLNDYLLAAGREGEFYREALELLESAEEAVRQVAAERRRAEAARRRAEAERRRIEARQRENDELGRRQREAAAVPLPPDALRSGGLAPEMVTVAAGRFQYLTWQRIPGREDRRTHLESVTFDRPFAIGKYEVTRSDFALFVDRARYRTEARRDPDYGCEPDRIRVDRRNSSIRWDRPGFNQTERHPVTCVSVRDAIAYARWLSHETGHRYRLPGAAEWQYAARAGSPEAMLYASPDNQDDSEDICRYGHVQDCPRDARFTVEVGSLLPNHIGLHDMAGNVEEILLACRHSYPRREGTEFWETNEAFFRFGGAGDLTPHGSPENQEACETHVGTAGGSWRWSWGRNVSLVYTGESDSLRVNPASRRSPHEWDNSYRYYRNSQTWTGFRLMRELPDAVAAR